MERGCGRVLRVGAQVYHTALQLGAVYFFEYVVSVAFAIRAPSAEINGAWWCRNGYQVLQMAYQTGVFLSRSSLGVLRVRRVGILTLLQAANFVGWYLHAVHHVLQSWQQVACMCWVGILGGLVYVNVFANLVDDVRLKRADRELAINLVSVCMNAGIAASALFQVYADSSFLEATACVGATPCVLPINGTGY
eukprot:Tamp_16302.p2 GENE.Tamp_16302~~Tamp_16302.p2  ORF type:complete len:203 (-),score=53.00 Tamp_16302:864-1442(-)